MAFALANLLLGALVALVVGQNARAICLPLGLMDFPDADGGRKLHAKDTPLAGGIALVLTVLATVVLQLPVAGDPQTGRMLLWFLIAVVGLFLVGLLDDRVGLSARIRLAAAAIILLAGSVRRGKVRAILPGVFPILAILGYAFVTLTDRNGGAQALFNLYLFILGLGLLVRGFRAQLIGTVNAGMLVLFGLILLRFFDEDLGFVFRGVVFVLLGAAFLAVNLVLARKKGAAP